MLTTHCSVTLPSPLSQTLRHFSNPSFEEENQLFSALLAINITPNDDIIAQTVPLSTLLPTIKPSNDNLRQKLRQSKGHSPVYSP